MSDFPRTLTDNLDALNIVTGSPQAIRDQMFGAGIGTGGSSAAWPGSGVAIGWPFRVHKSFTINQISWRSGNSPSGNFDAGVYDKYGNRIVATGSVSCGLSTNAIVASDITDTTLGRGYYYAVLSMDGTQPTGCHNSTAVSARAAGAVMVASGAFSLPSTLTFVTTTSGVIPYIILHGRSTV